MSERKSTKDWLEEAFRPYLEHEHDASPEARKRARILRAATELFEKQGYRKTSIDEIARRAEVAKGTVYLYFPSKAQVLVHAIAVQKKAMLHAFQPLLSGAIPERERLRYYVGVVLVSARAVPLAARVLTGDAELTTVLDEVGPSQFEQNRARNREWVMALIELAAPGVLDEDEKRLRADALSSLGYLSVMLLDERLRFGRSVDELAGALADMVVYGAIHRPPASRE